MQRAISLQVNTDNDLLSEAFSIMNQLQGGDATVTAAVVGSAQTLVLVDIAESLRVLSGRSTVENYPADSSG